MTNRLKTLWSELPGWIIKKIILTNCSYNSFHWYTKVFLFYLNWIWKEKHHENTNSYENVHIVFTVHKSSKIMIKFKAIDFILK